MVAKRFSGLSAPEWTALGTSVSVGGGLAINDLVVGLWTTGFNAYMIGVQSFLVYLYELRVVSFEQNILVNEGYTPTKSQVGTIWDLTALPNWNKTFAKYVNVPTNTMIGVGGTYLTYNALMTGDEIEQTGTGLLKRTQTWSTGWWDNYIYPAKS